MQRALLTLCVPMQHVCAHGVEEPGQLFNRGTSLRGHPPPPCPRTSTLLHASLPTGGWSSEEGLGGKRLQHQFVVCFHMM